MTDSPKGFATDLFVMIEEFVADAPGKRTDKQRALLHKAVARARTDLPLEAVEFVAWAHWNLQKHLIETLGNLGRPEQRQSRDLFLFVANAPGWFQSNLCLGTLASHLRAFAGIPKGDYDTLYNGKSNRCYYEGEARRAGICDSPVNWERSKDGEIWGRCHAYGHLMNPNTAGPGLPDILFLMGEKETR